MAEPRTWLLLNDIQACLSQIQIANGYHTDAGLNITLEPQQNPDDGGTLIEVSLAGIGKATEVAVAKTHRLVTISVAAMVSVDANNHQLVLHRIHEDVEQAFIGKQAQFGDGRAFPTFVSSVPIKPAQGMRWVGADIRYTTHVRIR